MRKIDKKSVSQPSSTLHTKQGFKNKVKNFIQEKNKSSKERKFNGYNSLSIKKALEKLYSNHTPISINSSVYDPKCAYCESNSNTTAVLQVEHYRPKKAVEEEPTHKGYYWLALEWTNLVYACQNCNNSGAKGTKFPIVKQRIYQENRDNQGDIIYTDFDVSSDFLKGEEPLLLHPEIDKPTEHLRFKNNGKLIGKTQRGRETIKICKLNRDLLIESRKDIVDDIISTTNQLLKLYLDKKINDEVFKALFKILIFEKIDNWNNSLNYTLVRDSIKTDFNLRVIQRLDPKIRQIVSFAHQDYLNGDL